MDEDKKLKEKRKQFVRLVSEDTLNNLLDDLLSDKVLNQEEVEIVKKKNYTTIDKFRDLMDFVIPKGPHAGQILMDHVCESHPTLANNLGFSSALPESAPAKHKAKPSAVELDPTHGDPRVQGRTDSQSTQGAPGGFELSTQSALKFSSHEDFLKRTEKEKSGEIYVIKEKKERKRLALIICNTEFEHLSRRDGADHDITGMKGLLEGLDYSVDVKENLTANEMESTLVTFAARPEHKSSDSTFLVFMSHGLLDKVLGIEHRDDRPDVLLYDTIFEIFNSHKCPNLTDKPKVIIIQACRGERYREAWVNDSPASSAYNSLQSQENLQDDGVHKTPVEKDFVAFCSSTPHDVSWRDENGSIFITELINCFKNHAWHFHLIEIFREVQRCFEKPGVKVQMPAIERLSMPKNFYLFPGN